MHQCYKDINNNVNFINGMDFLGKIFNIDFLSIQLVPPTSITQMENIFSGVVFAETLPNPTDVKLLQVK